MLAERGWQVLSFDYAGTGESPGDFSEVTWESLLADGRALLEAARAGWGGGLLVALGIRLGARIALEAGAGRGAELAHLFWQPAGDAAAWWTEARRRSRFRGTGGAETDASGSADLDGYAVSPALAAALASKTLDSLPAPGGRWKGLQIGAQGSIASALQAFAQRCGPAGGFETVRMPPFWLETDVAEALPLAEATAAALEEWADGVG